MTNRFPIRARKPGSNFALKPSRKPSEDGYMLLAVIFMLFLFSLALAVAAPEIAKSIQRDREVETMERGKQYIRAIQLYYRKFQSYPPSIDALVKTNNIRFLRKKYIDPMTGKDDWKPILFGQNKAPLAMGFFGQPLAGLGGAAPIAGIGPNGGNGVPDSGFGSQSNSGFGSSTGGSFGSPGGAFGSPSGGFGSSPGGLGSSLGGSSLFGSPNTTPNPTTPTPNGNPTDSSNNANGANGATGTSGSNGATSGTNADGNSASSTGTETGSGFMSGQNGQTFGGGGVIGVEPALAKASILIYKKKDHYNQWEFTYTPLADMMTQAGGNAGMIGQPVGAGVNGANGTNGSNNGFGSAGFGGTSNGFGGTGFGGSTSGGMSNGFGGMNSGGSFGASNPSPSTGPIQQPNQQPNQQQ